MRRARRSFAILARKQRWMVALVLALTGLTAEAYAKKQPKTYPEQGKVTATSVNQVPYRQTISGPNGTSSVKRIRTTRTYTVVTDTRTFELDCGKTPPLFSSTPGECGGDRKIQIGDVIHFRIEKGWAYISAPETSDPVYEEKLRILDEQMKAGETAGPSTESEKTDANGQTVTDQKGKEQP